ncbi:hypothetical protein ACCO45_007805 [Purpureocillium lilacinum]|uniref:Uncharacterized protein n=1 Tax=Purpureocillium lilacinum TaxID=33203 RepID=A0ACC4DN09_PURLI
MAITLLDINLLPIRELPIIGRVHGLPRQVVLTQDQEGADEYGPVYKTPMMGQRLIVVSDEGIARDLIKRMGDHFGGRPQIRAG